MKFRASLIPITAAVLVAVSLAGCGLLTRGTPQPLPTVVLGNPQGSASTAAPAAATAPATSAGASTPASASAQSNNTAQSSNAAGGVSASGNVAPAQLAQLAAAAGGNILAVNVKVGDKVQAGQVLIQLAGSEKVAAAVEAANVELLTAQQALQALNDNAAQARSAAQLRLANAQKALDDAQKRRTWAQYRNGTDSMIQTGQADVILAKDNLKRTHDNFDGFLTNDAESVSRASALTAISAAQKAYDKAVADLNYLLAMPNKLDVNQAEATLQAAISEVDSAQHEYDKLKNGPDPDAWALGQERVKDAQAQLSASQADLANLELKAPFAGTISQVSVASGEWATPGQPLLMLADLAHLQVQTTDLSERDVPKVAVGQPVTVQVKSLNLPVKGHVSQIAPLADTLGGDVVYKVTIDLDGQLPALRAGMSVTVQFGQ